MTPAEAAARLGIPTDDYLAFELLVDRMRTPNAEQEELARLRGALERVNEELRKAGIEYPLGAAGVRDLRGFVARAEALAQDQLDTLEAKAAVATQEQAAINQALQAAGVGFPGLEGVQALAGLYSDALARYAHVMEGR
ncbi:hypothetical protein MF672_051070 (plasmid) [Actinomadura sp. ATCC 31491]|uniref:Uncharacterized protein n=1 Tax=Actinomadura luzonensis TaxID=2805427 RepID=A0ABT0GBZ5_9ACTN|nr:hypothetical protein [Actinomadura luzonensis]MCK2222096.1 hypothetical protein [Actinomadura luzonensis]